MKSITNRETKRQRFVVEWCESCPGDGGGGCDIDSAVRQREPYPTIAEATARAQRLVAGNLDFFGQVCIEEQEVIVNADILEHEGRTVRQWHTTRMAYVTEPDEVPMMEAVATH